jgi:threonine dehydratase
VIVPIGGGGLIAGMALILKHINPRIKVTYYVMPVCCVADQLHGMLMSMPMSRHVIPCHGVSHDMLP